MKKVTLNLADKVTANYSQVDGMAAIVHAFYLSKKSCHKTIFLLIITYT